MKAISKWAAMMTVLFALSSASCSVLPPANLRPPDVAIADLALTDIGLDRFKFRAALETFNPNDLVVPLTNVRVDLTVLDVKLAEGLVIERRVELPARGRTTIPVEFTVPTARLLDLITRFRTSGWATFDYRLAGSANWGDTPFGVPFERSGNLDVLKRLADIFGAR